MIGIPQKTLYEFCLQDWKEVELALTELAQAKESLVAKNVPNLDKLYKYIYPLYDIITAGANGPQWSLGQSVLKFLSVEVVKKFLANPADAEVHEALSVQLVMLYTATGHQTALEPYTAEELKQVLAGTSSYYDDFILAHTLFNIISQPAGDKAVVDALTGILVAEGGAEFFEPNSWEAIFLLDLMIYALWVNLEALDEARQELLFRNYFYVSIVMGVPVRTLAVNFAFTGTQEAMAEKNSLLVSSLLNSNEEIPVNLQEGEVKKLAEIIKNYGAQLGGEKSSGFAQEEFIKGFYANQPARDIWRGWLRELLVAMNHLSGY